jgi:hypothetical protein
MSSAGELFDRVFPETPEPVNERHWLVESRAGASEVIVLHSPNYRDLAVVADGVIVTRRGEDFEIEQRVEVPFRLGERDLVVTLEKAAKEAGAPDRPLESLFVYDLFVDGRSVTDNRRLEDDRAKAEPPLTRGGRTLLMLLRMIPSAGAPGVVLGLNRGSGGSLLLMVGAISALALVAGASYGLANHLLRMRTLSARTRLASAIAASLLIWLIGLPLALAVVILGAR